jgi:hypothetical protein
MANCENYKITVMNSTHGEIKVTKFEYKDGSNWKTENMLGLDGHQKIEEKHGLTWTRDLEGVGNEDTQFRRAVQRSGMRRRLRRRSRPPMAARKRSWESELRRLDLRMLKAKLRSLAKTPGLMRMRERSSPMVTSRL